MTKKFAIFDLDNCLADDAWRIPLVDWSHTDPGKRYAAYHEACGKDGARNLLYLRRAINAGWGPLFLTGRPESVRGATVLWIDNVLHAMKAGGEIDALPAFALLMRGNNDQRPSVEIKRDQTRDLEVHWGITTSPAGCQIAAAYDDREDIVEMYRSLGIPAHILRIHEVDAYNAPTVAAPTVNAADVMAAGAALFRERNAVYQDNFLRVAPIMAALFPDGAPAHVLHNPSFHLLELLVVKLTRFAISEMTHRDSIDDAVVYAAMIAANVQRGLSANKEQPQ